MLRPTDRILAPGRGDAKQLLAVIQRNKPVGPYVDWVYGVQKFCNSIGMDRSIIWWQGIWETGWFRDGPYWNEGNSGGLGIDADGWPTPFDINPNAGEDSAMVHVATMWAMLGNVAYPASIRKARTELAEEWLEHVEMMVRDRNRPPVARLEDLNQRFHSDITGDMEATWAWDENYVTGICDRANASGVITIDQSLMTPLQAFHGSRVFHARGIGMFRAGPSRTTPVVKSLSDGQRLRCKGWREGQRVEGSSKWLVLAGQSNWHIHSSGVREIFS